MKRKTRVFLKSIWKLHISWVAWTMSLLVLVQYGWMTVRLSVEAIVLDTQALRNKKNFGSIHLDTRKLEANTGSIYIPRQHRSNEILSEITVQLKLLNLKLRVNAPLMFPYSPSIIVKYNYTRLGNIITGIWNVGKVSLRRMKHVSSFNISMAMLGCTVCYFICYPA